MRASLDKLQQSARGQSVLVAWVLWLVGPKLYLVTLCVALLAAPQQPGQDSAAPCAVFWAHPIGALATAVVCLFSAWQRAELWLTLCYYGAFWVFAVRLAAQRSTVGMVGVLTLAAAAPAGVALVRVMVGAAKGRYRRGGRTDV